MKRFFKAILTTSWHEKKLFFFALLWMYYYACYLKITPFKVWIGQINTKKSHYEHNTKKNVNLFQLKRALLRAGKCYFFQNKCLAQALAGKRILKAYKISSTIFLGLKSDKTFIAHAWLIANEFELVEKNDDFTEILKID